MWMLPQKVPQPFSSEIAALVKDVPVPNGFRPQVNEVYVGFHEEYDEWYRIHVSDIKDATANTFDVVVDRDNNCKESFDFVVNIPNLKLLPGDYFVSISSKLISSWQNTNYPVEYFIALERTSSYGV